MSSNPQQVQAIFLAAVEMSPTERTAYLARECGDDAELRQRVEALLRANDDPGSFLDTPLGGLNATADQPITERPGTQIGPYKLLQQIGEGGMGVVYMAEQKEPVRRRVALKIIKPGMDTRQVIARFEAERQALAMMDHPNIAKVLDAGATESGRPYFVMELVNGLPVTKYCDDQHLAPKERLELFIPICQAIQHAHQKGIIHRDLKPSNILVALYDGRTVPKIIDFGVAKATSQTLTEKTMFTQLGQLVGTLEYMSPEQAERNQLDIDTRSDVYSLGVVLYELLTGETPFDRERLRSAAFEEVLRIIREEKPSKPSTKVSSSHSLPSIAANRRTEPARLGTMIRGDLDWVVMKALEKDRGRRYETASKFAEDVQHYLDDEPVQACPPSAAYRFRKFAQRNKVALATTCVLSLTLLLAVGSVGWILRDRTARQLRLTGQVELILEEVDRLVEARQWPEALAAAKRAEAVVAGGNAGGEIARQVRQNVLDLTLVRQLNEARLQSGRLQNGSLYYAGAGDLYDQAFSEAGLDLDELSMQESAQRLRRRKKILPVVASALLEWQNIREIARAAAAKTTPNDARRRSVESHYALLDLADEIDPNPWRRRLRNAIRVRQPAVLQDLAESANVRVLTPSDLSSLSLAVSTDVSANAAAALLERAQRQYPDDFWINFDLDVSLRESTPPRPSEAVTFCRIALALRPGNVAVLNNLGNALRLQGRHDEAIACYSQAVDSDPQFALAHSNLGVALSDQGNFTRALEHHRKAVELAPEWATAHDNLGITLYRMGNVEDAISCYRKAIEFDPANAPAHVNLAIALKKQGELEKAVSHFRAAIELNPHLVMAHHILGTTLGEMGRLKEATESLRTAVQLAPQSSSAHHDLGIVLYRQEKVEEAIECWQEAIALDSENAGAHNNLGVAVFEQGRLDEAIESWRKAVDLNPKDPGPRFNLAHALYQQNKLNAAVDSFRVFIRLNPRHAPAHEFLGDALADLGEVKKAVDCYRTAMALDTEDPQPRAKVAWHLATTDDELQNVHEAIALAREAIELQPDLATAWGALGIAQYRADQWQDAIDALEKAREVEAAENPTRAFVRAMSHWQLAHETVAVESYRQAFSSDTPSSFNACQRRFRDEAKQLLGLRVSDQEITALARLESAHAAAPEDADAACALARQLATIDDPVYQDMERALELARQAAASAPNSRAVLDTLSTVACWSRDWDTARDAREAITQEEGGVPSDWLWLSMIYWHLGDQTESRRWCEKVMQHLEQPPHGLGWLAWPNDKTEASAENDDEQKASDEPTAEEP